MAIEFGCPGCHQTLRVPETAAGKVAKCPSCSTVATVPDGSLLARDQAFSASDHSARSAKDSANPFADAANPYGGESIQPYQLAGVPLNPYASPSGFDAPWQGRFGDAEVGNQQITVSAILNEANVLWQNQLGLLIGMTVLMFVIIAGFQLIGSQVLLHVVGRIHWNLVWPASSLLWLGMLVLQTFLTVGQIQLCLKMCRREPFEFSDLFNGGSRFVPALMASLIVEIPSEVLATLARLAFDELLGLSGNDARIASVWLMGLVALVFNLLFWPYYYLVIDEKASVLESFGMAYRVTEGNRATSFLMWLCSALIILVGLLACIVGVVAAIPLTMMMQAVAYLMMSGQMPPEGYPRQQSYAGS
jgi:hypothetical protein